MHRAGIYSTGFGGRAPEEESSFAPALFPERIRMDEATKAREAELKPPSLKTLYISFIRPWKYVGDTIGLGDPAKGTAEKERRLIDLFLERISTFLKELSDAQWTETFPY